jgi:hypothetical protein
MRGVHGFEWRLVTDLKGGDTGLFLDTLPALNWPVDRQRLETDKGI